MTRSCTPNAGGTAGYRILEHTADVALAAWGPTPAAAFVEAAFGMYAVMLGEDPREWGDTAAIEIAAVPSAGATWDDLLVNWLAELLFRFEADGFVAVEVAMAECAPPRCRARLYGSTYAAPVAPGGLPIKGVTYHQLRVEVTPERTALQVILDV
jgi:SHS2 domain-containing protein